MKNYFSDTIVALATPEGRGGIAVIRVSGNSAREIAFRLTKKNLTPRLATYTPFFDASNEVIDQGIALFFKAPHSFTGEDVLELHGHGGQHVVQLVLDRVLQLGTRLSRPGEFSERAFLNNKIDLVQAEAIADLIDASSKEAAIAAMRSLQGDFSKKINEFLTNLIYVRTYIEASIDFVDEEIDFWSNTKIHAQLHELQVGLNAILQTATQGSLLREGLTAVIVGQPNVGKSSLLNQLSGEERAIVTNIPGTTRDVIREKINIDGLILHIVDTAGLRETLDIVEQEGIKRTYQELNRAHLALVMVEKETEVQQLLKNITSDIPIIIIKNKIDLKNCPPEQQLHGSYPMIALSAKTGAGIDLLKQTVKEKAGFQTEQSGTFLARKRHLDALIRARTAILEATNQLTHHRALELAAEELRLAQNALNEVTGEFSSDDLLGKIFSNFCIGK